MNIYCPRCAEPWDVHSLHDAVADGYAADYADARRTFAGDGCGTLFGGPPCQRSNHPRAHLAAELFDVLGEDVDAVAAMHADAEFLGWDR